MDSHDALARSVEVLASFVVGRFDLRETLEQVAGLAVEAIEPAAFAGMTLIVDGRPTTGVFTDPQAPEIDESQYRTGRGPCLDSFDTGRINHIGSTIEDRRWPEFSAAARAHGIRSTLAVPLSCDGRRLGAMNLYSDVAGGFGEAHPDQALRFAAQAATVLANAVVHHEQVVLNVQLAEAMKTREVIGQAQGIIMASMRCDAETAFQHLVRQSQHENRKLRDVAEGIVRDVSRPRA